MSINSPLKQYRKVYILQLLNNCNRYQKGKWWPPWDTLYLYVTMTGMLRLSVIMQKSKRLSTNNYTQEHLPARQGRCSAGGTVQVSKIYISLPGLKTVLPARPPLETAAGKILELTTINLNPLIIFAIRWFLPNKLSWIKVTDLTKHLCPVLWPYDKLKTRHL